MIDEQALQQAVDLTKLAHLLRTQNIALPLSDDQLRWLNPFAVTFGYDDMDIELIALADATDLVMVIRR